MTHFQSTPAVETRCPRCHAQTLTALDEGIPTRVNAAPLLDHQAEIAALLNGLWTYTRLRNNHLTQRNATRITDPNLHGPTHAEHKCNGAEQLTIEDVIGAK